MKKKLVHSILLRHTLLYAILLFCFSCEALVDENDPHHKNFENRIVSAKTLEGLETGKSYLSVYSQIYSLSEHKTHNLTVTASIRNISTKDTVYITKAVYNDLEAKPIHTYFEKPIYLAPFETVEIVIDEVDQAGRAGANFIFDWKIKKNATEPYFESIMISTYGARGLSFTFEGKRIE